MMIIVSKRFNLLSGIKLKIKNPQFFTSEMFRIKVVTLVFRGKVGRDSQCPGQR